MSFHRIKPILFNTEMVRAILDGRKTVTRRVIKPRNAIRAKKEGYEQGGYGLWIDPSTDNGDKQGHIKDYSISAMWSTWKWYIDHYAPYQVGDILYIRETWREYNGKYFFKANEPKEYDDYKTLPKWKPSIHMPKEAARIFLKVTDVRVERLQEITDEECKAEGTNLDDWYDFDEWQHQAGDGCVADGIPVVFETLRGFFGSTIWNSTLKSEDEYDKYCWNANPWVWVIEFERIER